jgi:hypothetical protein
VPNHTKFQPFAQALFGGVQGFDSYFPAPFGKLSASCLPWLGGWLDVTIRARLVTPSLPVFTNLVYLDVCMVHREAARGK